MARHWDTEVLTTCALDYMQWDNYYPEGLEVASEVTIRRFRVDVARDVARFDDLSGKLLNKGAAASLQKQEEWMRAQGPLSSGLFNYLETKGHAYDAVVFFGYLYATTYFGLPLVREKAFMAPLGHDEWPIHLSMWDEIFAMPQGYIFQTHEELSFLRNRFPTLTLEGPVAGIGVETPGTLAPQEFRRRYGLTEPFLLYVGRIDASKGCDEMFDWFKRRKHHLVQRLKLVVIGQEVFPVPFDDDIVYLGFVSEEEKWNAMAACDWLLLPSQYESLSIALLETWAVGRPAIVNAQSEVLVGHCRRGNGGLWYENWNQCEAILRSVDGPTKAILGEQGQAYVRDEYSWSRVEGDYLLAVGGKSAVGNSSSLR